MIMGGDHSIGYPCVRGVAQCVEGKVGIIHLDRHIDTQEKDMDEIGRDHAHLFMVPCD